mmetsp:Transcript_124628/g.399089  ORF Transcript_124628/g.399089 Transcript_124628/m.399089 type:complete len:212 (-) Transcript_124628:1058-1693(-)
MAASGPRSGRGKRRRTPWRARRPRSTTRASAGRRRTTSGGRRASMCRRRKPPPCTSPSSARAACPSGRMARMPCAGSHRGRTPRRRRRSTRTSKTRSGTTRRRSKTTRLATRWRSSSASRVIRSCWAAFSCRATASTPRVWKRTCRSQERCEGRQAHWASGSSCPATTQQTKSLAVAPPAAASARAGSARKRPPHPSAWRARARRTPRSAA